MERLFEQISNVLAQRFQDGVSDKLAPFAKEVVCIDESTLDAVSRRLPALRAVPDGDSRLLPGKLSGAFDLRRQQWRAIRFQPNPQQNEKVMARDLAAELPVGTLLVADLGYFGLRLVRLAHGQKLSLAEQAEGKDSYEVVHVFHQRARCSTASCGWEHTALTVPSTPFAW